MSANHRTIIDTIRENARELQNLVKHYPDHEKRLGINIFNVLNNVATKIETLLYGGNHVFLNGILEKLRSFVAVSLHFSIITAKLLRLEDILQATNDRHSQQNKNTIARKLAIVRQNSYSSSTDVQSLGTNVIDIMNNPSNGGQLITFDRKMTYVTGGLLKGNSDLIEVKNNLCEGFSGNWKQVFDIRPIISVDNWFTDKAGPFVRKFFCALGTITSIGTLAVGCVIAHAAYELYTKFISDGEPDLEHPHMSMLEGAIGHLKVAWEAVKPSF